MSDHVNQDDQLDWAQLLEELDWSLLDASVGNAVGLGLDPTDARESVVVSQLQDSMVSLNGSPSAPSSLESNQNSATSDGEAQVQTSSYSTAGQKQRKRFKCEGCNDELSRRYELKRHISTKHDKEKPFVCTVAGCFKKRAPPAFARSDKLTDHYKTVHKRHESAKCPLKGCGKNFPLEFTGAHIDRAHYSSSLVQEALRPLRNAFDKGRRACPYWNCGEKVELASFMEHILSHSTDDLNRMEESLRRDHYFYVRSGCSHEAAVDRFHRCAVTALCILCPLCGEVSGNHAAFEQHVFARHLLGQDAAEREHFYQWQHYVVSTTGLKNATGLRPWKPWPVHSGENGKCPACQEKFEGRNNQENDAERHHLSILRNTEEVVAELYPHRQAILRLYPDFKSHPVFADLK